LTNFAEGYTKNDDGLWLFPKDDKYRKHLFPLLNLSEHPAKANIYLVQAITEFVSKPDETVMDIMAGTGTIMTAALIGRRVVCIELEDKYITILEQNAQSLEAIAPGIGEEITVIQGDCNVLLPLQIADHVIFSPPYSNIFKKKTMDKLSAETLGDGLLTYSDNPNNVGNLNEFHYHQKMERIYSKVLQSLPVGGTLTVIIKDHIEGGKPAGLCTRAARDCLKMGWVLWEWHKWLPPGSVYTSFMRARGDKVIDEEDIIILRKDKSSLI